MGNFVALVDIIFHYNFQIPISFYQAVKASPTIRIFSQVTTEKTLSKIGLLSCASLLSVFYSGWSLPYQVDNEG